MKVWLSIAVLIATGCVGRPLVGVLPEPDPPLEACVGPTYPCTLFNEVPMPDAIDPQVFVATPRCVSPAPTATECAEFHSGADITDIAARGCAGLEPIAVTGSLQMTGIDLECGELVFDLEPGAQVEIHGSRLEGVQISVHGAPSSVFRLSMSSGADVAIRSSGQVWVEIDRSQFDQLQLIAEGLVEGRAHYLVDSEVHGLVMQSGARAHAHLQRSLVNESTLAPFELIADETSVTRSEIAVEEMLFTAGAFDASVGTVRRGTFVATRINSSTIRECGELRLFEALTLRSHFEACDRPLEVVGGELLSSTVRGGLDSVAGTFIDTGFAGGPETLEFESATVERSGFCGETHLAAAASSVRCSSCMPEIASAELMGSVVENPECPSLDAFAASI